MTELNQIDLRALARGDKRTWDAFVAAAAPLVAAVVRRVLAAHRLGEDDVMDAAQDVFVRLCAHDFRLVKSYDPARAGLPTWLAVVARSCAVDHLRRRRRTTESLDEVPESALGIEDRHVEKLKIPVGLLTPRQVLILRYLYDEERDVAEVGRLLGIDAQTVRSTHHKALLRLRAHFQEDPAAGGG